MPSLGESILAQWSRLSPLPGGKWLFSRALGRRVRYTDSIRPLIVDLQPGYARAEIADTPAKRNHLGSVHAIALMNAAEVVSGLAMLTALPSRYRGIVTRMEIDYVKKARGRLTSESTVRLPELADETTLQLTSVVRDASGADVARATVHWLISKSDSTHR